MEFSRGLKLILQNIKIYLQVYSLYYITLEDKKYLVILQVSKRIWGV